MQVTYRPYSAPTRAQGFAYIGPPPPPSVYELICLPRTGREWEHQQRVAACSHIGPASLCVGRLASSAPSCCCFSLVPAPGSSLATAAPSLVTCHGSPGSIMHQRLSLLSFVASPHQFPLPKFSRKNKGDKRRRAETQKDSVSGDGRIKSGDTFSKFSRGQ